MSKPEDNPAVRVLKTATCKTVTGKSTLTYQIGCLPDSRIHLRISKNSGAGQFSNEWIPLSDVRKSLDKAPEGHPLTSFLLQPLFNGKSVNTPAFMLAALSNERLLRVLKGKKRGHEFLDPEGFTDRMDRLAASKAKPKGATSSIRKKAVTKKATRKKVAAKKKSMPRRKTENTT
jgi:hypothetical protein